MGAESAVPSGRRRRGWGAANIMMEKAWGRQMLGGGICMGIGGIWLVHSFSQGNAVNLDTDLGN